jgi:uncharacterized protein YyaL (SSP411 family)
VAQNVTALRDHLARAGPGPAGAPDPKVLDGAARSILSVWDRVRGSFQGAPKFPNAAVLDVLWRAHLRTGEEGYGDAVRTTLRSLCQGGIYDHLGGGFARYAVDAAWKVPHFEKMLYDNGLLLSLLSFAYRHGRDPLFRARIGETVGWLSREMQLPGGGFASSLDADTEHEEGLTYTWTWPELEAALGGELAEFAALYDASPEGNWEGKIILNRVEPRSANWLGDETEDRLARIRDRLLEQRMQRPQPGRDDKVLADWNGLAISGLAQAARATGAEEPLLAARRAFCFVAEGMGEGDRLAHSRLGDALVRPGFATDYANMIGAALDLFAVDGDLAYLEKAQLWFASADSHHFDAEAAAYRLAADDADPLIARPLSITDEATPAATGTMAQNAAHLFALTGEDRYRNRAEQLVAHLGREGPRDVVGTASLQAGYDTLLRGRVAFVVGASGAAAPLMQAALGEADPALLVARAAPADLPPGHPAGGKRPSDAAALFLCDAFRCLPEIATAKAARETLSETRRGLA